MDDDKKQKTELPHHKQQELCTTRLQYRQGRKLTAVKVYTVNNESNHLLIFGVPSLNLRQEAKNLFLKFGKLMHFTQTTDHPAESFTETYHARYEKIQSARVAKKMLDTKNFYGGSLHVCYAPEFEHIDETRYKLMQRKRDVAFRLINLEKDTKNTDISNKMHEQSNHNNLNVNIDHSSTANMKNDNAITKNDGNTEKINMGNINTIIYDNNSIISVNKRKLDIPSTSKKFKPCFIKDEVIYDKNIIEKSSKNNCNNSVTMSTNNNINNTNIEKDSNNCTNVEIVDFTSTEKETISNINEALNYKNFGNEIIRKIPKKAVNTINFNVGNKS